jgi:alpha-tubulin suppressor-like RCC1 family protein
MGDTTVMAWGSDSFNGLADGTAADGNAHPTPTQVLDVAGTGNLTGVSKIDGDMALLSDGHVVTWGLNDTGQLGNGSTIGTTVNHPVAVTGIPLVDTTVGVQTIATSETNDAVLGADGTMWVWGSAVANGGASDSSTPHQVTGLTVTDDDIVSVGAGFETTFAVVP